MGYCLRMGLSCAFYMFERTRGALAKPAHTTWELVRASRRIPACTG